VAFEHLLHQLVDETVDGYNEGVQVHGLLPSIGIRAPWMVEEFVGLDQKNLHTGLAGTPRQVALADGRLYAMICTVAVSQTVV
jgi:hypothetical protein